MTVKTILYTIFNFLNPKKTKPEKQNTALANMLVDHMQAANNRPTAIVKNGNRGY